MNILVTGGAGYVGSVLLPKLVSRGHCVKLLDTGYFGLDHLKALFPKIEIVHGDIRQIKPELLAGCDAVIHLAAISNDPSADLNFQLTDEVNCRATENLALLAKDRGIKFIFSSSCAVYGSAAEEIDETGPLGPITTYAQSKLKAEEILISLADKHWSPVILRNGTLFGLSSRMRFDLVLNIFSLYSTLYNEIKVFGDGLYWRPFLHVTDCARALLFFAEKDRCRHMIYNIAHQNLRVCELVPIFQGLNPNLKVTHLKSGSKDDRSYQVLTGRMKTEGFQTQVSVGLGAEEMIDALVNGLIRKPESTFYNNAKWMTQLMPGGALEEEKIADSLIKAFE